MLPAFPALAQTVQPVGIEVVLNVQNGCTINGGEETPEGLLNFGTVTNIGAISGNIDGSTTATDSGTPFAITCDGPIGQILATISGGENDLGGTRRLANQDDPGQFIPYHMYLDEGRTVEFEIDAPVPLFEVGGEVGNRLSSQFIFDIYGRIFSPVNVTAGSYVDATTIRLTF
jgi:spore coat protein U-like protein